LVVDDDPSVRQLLVDVLAVAGYRTAGASSAQTALDLIAGDRPAVVLLDSTMPGVDGLAVLRRLRADESTKMLPVILMTGLDEIEQRVAGLDAGADDYVTKPVDIRELVARVRAHLRGVDAWHEAVDRTWDQRIKVANSIARIARDPAAGEPAAAVCDALLELPNVDGAALLVFRDEEVEVLAESGLRDWAPARPLPRALALRMIRRCDEGAWIDEPAMRAKRRSHTIPAAFAPLIRGGIVIGLLVLARDPRSESVEPVGQLLSIAVDVAPAVAEVAAVRILGPSDPVARHAELEVLIARKGFVTVFQPIVRIDDRGVVGFEALTRFDDKRQTDLWFSEAVDLGLATPLERVTLRNAIVEAGRLPPDTYLSLNVSASLLKCLGALREMLTLVDRPVVIELTERDVVDDYDAVRATIADLGVVSLAVDDAGAGYSSLSHILALRPDVIKLDKTWVRDVATDTARQALVSGLVHFAM